MAALSPDRVSVDRILSASVLSGTNWPLSSVSVQGFHFESDERFSERQPVVTLNKIRMAMKV